MKPSEHAAVAQALLTSVKFENQPKGAVQDEDFADEDGLVLGTYVANTIAAAHVHTLLATLSWDVVDPPKFSDYDGRPL